MLVPIKIAQFGSIKAMDDSNFIKEIVNFYVDMNFLQYQGILE